MKELKNLDCKNKRIIVRVDLNVPVFEDEITDRSRIYSILPTLEKLLKNKNKIFLITHFGRPKGESNKKYSTEFLCSELKKILNLSTIHFLDKCDPKKIKTKISEMQLGEICLLENIRFNSGEEKNDPIFSKTLSVVHSASSVRCLRMQKAAQLGSSSCASLALRLHVATAIPSDCSEN